MAYKKSLKIGLLLIGIGILAFIYGSFDPYNNPIFPKCPFLQITGLKCPGCGSQRALHNLLHLNFSKAFFENPLLILSLPYILFGMWIEAIEKPSATVLKWRKRFYGLIATYIALGVIIGYWILRNVF